MPAIVEFSKVVQDAVRDFGDLFSCEPQRQHFAEYLTGLMIAQNKTVITKMLLVLFSGQSPQNGSESRERLRKIAYG